jgi:hypothetical protein
MKKKFKSIILGIVVATLGVFSALTLSGCGANLDTLKTDYAAMQTKLKSYSSVFTEGNVDGITTTLMVDLGDYVNAKIQDAIDDDFDELSTKYNSILVISNDYIEQNIGYITGYNESDLTKAAKNSLKTLCKKIESFTDYLSTFVAQRNSLATYFEQFPEGNAAEVNSKLVVFKKSYGELVNRNVEISKSLANCVENTEVYKILEKTDVTENSITIIREYTRAKLLPIFSEFMLTEISNKFNWSNYKDKTDSLKEIDEYLTKLEDIFNGSYKSTFVFGANSSSLKEGTIKDYFEMVNQFLLEADSFFDALSELGIKDFAVSYDGKMEDYLSSNPLAERDMHKIEQFIGITLTNFITEASKVF